MTNNDADNTVIVEDVLNGDEDNEGDTYVTPKVETEQLGRGTRTRTTEVPYRTIFIGKTYPVSLFLQVPVHNHQEDFTTKTYMKYDEGTALLNVHAGAGYKLQREVQGVIHLNLGEEPSLPGLTEAQVDNRIMGVIFVHQYTLEKGIKKFGDRAEVATSKELK